MAAGKGGDRHGDLYACHHAHLFLEAKEEITFMNLFLKVLLIICAIGLVVCLYMFIRNHWVFRNRVRLIGTPDYHRLPSYDYMMSRWWVWNIKKFLKD